MELKLLYVILVRFFSHVMELLFTNIKDITGHLYTVYRTARIEPIPKLDRQLLYIQHVMCKIFGRKKRSFELRALYCSGTY